jgi:hypothetical protein
MSAIGLNLGDHGNACDQHLTDVSAHLRESLKPSTPRPLRGIEDPASHLLERARAVFKGLIGSLKVLDR